MSGDVIRLVGGPADGKTTRIPDDREIYTATVRPKPDPARPRRGRPRSEEFEYRRTSRGVGTALIPRRYVFVAPQEKRRPSTKKKEALDER